MQKLREHRSLFESTLQTIFIEAESLSDRIDLENLQNVVGSILNGRANIEVNLDDKKFYMAPFCYSNRITTLCCEVDENLLRSNLEYCPNLEQLILRHYRLTFAVFDMGLRMNHLVSLALDGFILNLVSSCNDRRPYFPSLTVLYVNFTRRDVEPNE